MALQGLHHITAITADAQANVDFYARLLGLRLVKKTVNFDEPSVYHLYFGDELGAPGSILTFFEFPGAAPGRAGDGQLHAIQWRVAGEEALAFWEARLQGAGVATGRDGGALLFHDPEGLAHELHAPPHAGADAPLTADAPDIPAEHALEGFEGVRAYASVPGRSTPLLEALGFRRDGDGERWLLGDGVRHARLVFDRPPAERARQGAGSIHHVAWSAADDAELAEAGAVAARAGARPTPVIDRQYFHSVYFREPSGVLFELASRDIGFTVDEPAAELGQALKLPPQYEAQRARIEPRLTPLANPRAAA
ncbi:MAG TPA: VOC family protein [Solirubrobacteraceae bacterium]|nr:VOC family protein [Solirubrobacteraceae bacterium]